MKCGDKAGPSYRIINDEIVCSRCAYRMLTARPCIVCSKVFKGAADWPEGRAVCPSCMTRLKKSKPCAHCGNLSLFNQSDSDAGIHEQICPSCRKNARINCSKCGKNRHPAALDENGRQICKQCHERGNKPFICRQCGKSGKPHSKHTCVDCYWRGYAAKHISSCQSLMKHEWGQDLFAAFIQELCERQTPHYAAMKVNRSFPFFSQLDVMFENKALIDSHALLAHFGPDGLRRFSTAFDFLACKGLIAELDRKEIEATAHARKQARIIGKAAGKWYEADLKSFHEHQKEMAARYSKRGWKEEGRFKPPTITSSVRAALLFFDHADLCDITSSSQLHGGIVDDFIAMNPGYRNPVRSLIRFLNQHVKVFRKLKVETLTSNLNRDLFIPPYRYAELVRNWLASDGDDAKKSLICLFMIIYAQPASKIVRLRLSDLNRISDGRFSIVFGNVEVEIERRIGNLIDCYIAHRKTLSMMEDEGHNEWLFPGRRFGSHITPAAVTEMLSQYGLKADQMFATAIFNAYQTGMRQPKVLVRGLGITDATAIKYLKLIDPRLYDEAERIRYSQRAV